MAFLKGKHTITEIDGVRCTVVETGLADDRVAFLKGLLEFNGFSVKVEKEKAKDGSLMPTSMLGVTDLIFNPAVALYQHKLLLKDGKEVTPSYWNQWGMDADLPYWQVKR